MGMSAGGEHARLKRTPLFHEHQRLGARLVDFGGWEMPVQYTGIVEEHLAVRQAAGLFDISHMGEVEVTGDQAFEFLNGILTNDLGKIEAGQGQYTLMCNSEGGVVDDLYIYRLAPSAFTLIINASRIGADLDWIEAMQKRPESPAGVQIRNRSDELGAVAVQGPRVADFFDAWFESQGPGAPASAVLTTLKKNQTGALGFAGPGSFVARTGYTGEDGFEIVAPAERLEGIWKTLLKSGQACGIKPAGLGARDTLRTEMGYPLYGHELDEKTTPLEAGLGVFVALDKKSFVGGEALRRQKAAGLQRKCAAFKMTGKSPPPRPNYLIYAGDDSQPVGRVVSGTQSPSLGLGIGMGYVNPTWAAPGTLLEIEVRANRVPAVTVSKPIYRKPV